MNGLGPEKTAIQFVHLGTQDVHEEAKKVLLCGNNFTLQDLHVCKKYTILILWHVQDTNGDLIQNFTSTGAQGHDTKCQETRGNSLLLLNAITYYYTTASLES